MLQSLWFSWYIEFLQLLLGPPTSPDIPLVGAAPCSPASDVSLPL